MSQRSKSRLTVFHKRGGTPPFWVGGEGGLLVIPHGYPPSWPAWPPYSGWVGGVAITTSFYCPPLKIMFAEYVVWRVIIFGGAIILVVKVGGWAVSLIINF